MVRVKGVALALLVAVGLAVPAAALAKVVQSPETVTVAKDQVIDDDLYVAAGRSLVIDGTVNGDVYAGSERVEIRGTVNGDVYAAASNLYLVDARIKGSVRVAGQTVGITRTTTGGGLTVIGQSIEVDAGTNIGGGVQFAGETVALRGAITRTIIGTATATRLGVQAGRDVGVETESLVLESGTRIGQQLSYNSTAELTEEGAVAIGSRDVRQAEERQKDDGGPSIGFIIWSVLALYLVSVILLLLAPSASLGVSRMVTTHPAPAFGWGLLLLVGALPLFFLTFITIIGIPLALLGLVGFGVAVYLTTFVVGLALGDVIASRLGQGDHPSRFLTSLFGILLISALGLIPVIGGLIQLAVVIFGLGAMLLYLQARRQGPVAPAGSVVAPVVPTVNAPATPVAKPEAKSKSTSKDKK